MNPVIEHLRYFTSDDAYRKSKDNISFNDIGDVLADVCDKVYVVSASYLVREHLQKTS